MPYHINYQILSISYSRMSPWQEQGLHQHPKFLPWSFFKRVEKFGMFFNLLAISYLYFWITWSLVPSFPILYGLANSDDSAGNRLPSTKTTPFLPIYTFRSSAIHSFRFSYSGLIFATLTLTTDIQISLNRNPTYQPTPKNIFIKLKKMLDPTNPPTIPQSRILSLLKHPNINVYTSDYIVEVISRDSLLKIEEFMRNCRTLKITGFMRFFRELLPFRKGDAQDIQFFLNYALFKLFTEICSNKKKVQISFSDISSYIAQKMPNFTQQSIIQQKLLPLGLNIDESHKAHINPPQIYGQILQDRYFLTQRPIRSDRIQHLSREVGQSEYSKKFKLYFSIDKPSTIISIYDDNFNTVLTLQTQQEMTKRDMVVNYIAWSDWEEKIACILGNYSISMWSKEDNYKYEVNVALPSQYLANPFTVIKYMNSMRKWITLDNRPAIYVLSNKNYEPEYMFINPKIKKKKESEKYFLAELNYVQLLCIGFERNLFLISLKNKQIVSQVHNFRTSITSIAFSQSYQALFVSTYQNYFRSYELSEHQDLMERGKFEGHKSQISLLGVIEQKPIVFSLQENSLLKMFDMRNYICYQSVSVLKNIMYKQVLYLEDAICLVGSKMHVYGIQKQLAYQQKQTVISIGTVYKDLLVVTNKNLRIYDIRNGALKSVVKAIFQSSETSSDIFSIFTLPSKQKIFIQSQQGQCIILQSKQMSQVQKWKLDPKPMYMYYDEQNDLLAQVSQGNIHINQFHNQFCQKQLRRSISNSRDVVRMIKISVKHDIIAMCYEEDDNLYFYAYEKGKMLGYLQMGSKKVIKFQNAYKPHKNIHRVIDLEFYENKSAIFLLLSDEIQFLTYKRSMSTMSFFIKKSIKLWQNPLKLFDGSEYKYNEADLQIPLHSTSMSVFETHIAITTNKANIFCSIKQEMSKISDIEEYRINKDNYNPSRVGHEEHAGSNDIRNPMITIKDYSQIQFEVANYVAKQSFGDFVLSAKVGNLLAVADDKLNVILWQSSNWAQIVGVLNCQLTLPKLWNIFKYSQQQIKQVQFVLNFIENEQKFPAGPIVKNLMQTSIKPRKSTDLSLSQITISQLIKQDRLKGGVKAFRSSSLREKKIVLQKEKEEKEKIENFLEQQKLESKYKVNTSEKNNSQKQINDTLGYLSPNHNQTIIKKGLIEEDTPMLRALQRKLDASINKSDKKSLMSYKTGEESLKTNNKMQQSISTFSLKNLKLTKTLSTQIYQQMTQKLGIKTYTSKQLIQKLNLQKNESLHKLRSKSKDRKLPKIDQS